MGVWNKETEFWSTEQRDIRSENSVYLWHFQSRCMTLKHGSYKNRWKTTENSRDAVFTLCIRLYSLGQGNEWGNEVTSRNNKLDKQIHESENNWLEHLQRIPAEGASKHILYYPPLGRCDQRRPRRRWLNHLMFEDGTNCKFNQYRRWWWITCLCREGSKPNLGLWREILFIYLIFPKEIQFFFFFW
jgi:hypothetical protein